MASARVLLLLLVVMVVMVAVAEATVSLVKDHRTLQKNVSWLLDTLLDKDRYDKRIRPDFGGPPVVVTVNMFIKSMGPVSETDEYYVLDCYFRQTWDDRRLAFHASGVAAPLSLPWLFLERVWKPDTFFVNGKRSHLHRITVPNKFLRLKEDGHLVYSMRLTIKASCPMHLRKFPLDTQKCPLIIGSFGYPQEDVVYAWQQQDSVAEDNVELAQYDLINITTEANSTVVRGSQKYSLIKVWFLLQRHTGYFMLQVFAPCCLIVCCSWVSFWIDPDAVPARVSLGVTTVLSMTTMGFGGRAQMPRVSYATALDWFVILCFTFVFAVMVEYAVINFIDKLTTDIRRLLEGASPPPPPPPTAVVTDFVHEANPVTDAAPDLPSLVVDLAPADEHADPVYAEVEDAIPAVSPPPPSPSPPLLSSPAFLSSRRRTRGGQELVEAALVVNLRDNRVHDADEEVEADDAMEAPLDTLEALEVHIRGSVLELTETLGSLTSVSRRSFRRWLTAPWRLWRRSRFLPREDDVRRLMASGEPPPKFSAIDIAARRYFPITFFSLFAIYWVLYLYYITDDFPARVYRDLLTKPARH